MNENILKTGTTTIGLVCKDGIVLAADKRATSGGSIVGSFTKVVPIGSRFALTMAGTVSDAIMLSRYLKAELKLKELRSSNEVTTREAANLLAQFVFANIRQMSMIPGVTHFLLAGKDQQGVRLFDIYPDGSINEVDEYFCSGSGSVFAFGLIDAEYEKNMSVEKGVLLAKKAIRSAITRDTASGNGYDIVAVTPEGVNEVETKVFASPIEKQ
jgi:proteasome beta subunit